MPEPSSASFPSVIATTTSLGGVQANQRQFVVSGDHNSSQTTITTTQVISGITAPCYLVVRSTGEIIYAEGISASQFTSCVRGASGTTPQAIPDGDTLYHVPVANIVNQIHREIIAIETELGTAPKTIDDTVAPVASPASVAAYLDMLAHIVKTMRAVANWHSAALPIFDNAEGDPADLGTAGPGTSNFAARRDHVHRRTSIFDDAAGDPTNLGARADGTSTFAARLDHVHSAQVTAKGDLLVASGGNVLGVLPVGADGTVLAADAAQPLGVRWAAGGAGGGSATMTNRSGSNLALGSVVVLDADNDTSFRTTTFIGDRRVVGVLGEAIANLASGRVLVGPQRATVLTVGNVARGQWLTTSSTAGRAVAAGYTRPTGAIGIALTAWAAGGNGQVEALLSVDHFLGASRGKGYTCGNQPESTLVQIMNYITETATAGPALPGASNDGGSLSSSTKAYHGRGSNSTTVYVAPFATDTWTTLAATLSLARWQFSTIQSATAGFFVGGFTNTDVDRVERLTFSTETVVATSSFPTTLAGGPGAHAQNASFGYIGGGRQAGGASSTIRRLNYSNETWATIAAALASARIRLAGVTDSSGNMGCFGGGQTAVAETTIDRLNLATEVRDNPTSLTAAKQRHGGYYSNFSGYWPGATTGVDRTTYSTYTTSAIAALPNAQQANEGSLGGASAPNY